MNAFCQDRDLLAIEPSLFIGVEPVGQRLVSGSDAAISQGALTADDADFTAADVQSGMVACVYKSSPSEGSAYEIVEVSSATAINFPFGAHARFGRVACWKSANFRSLPPKDEMR